MADAGVLDVGTDAGPADTGPADAGVPTSVTLRVSWTLDQQGTSRMCSDLPGEDGVRVRVTPTGSSALTSLENCEMGTATMTNVPFGDYSLEVDVLDGSAGVLASAPIQLDTAAASPCDEVAGDACVVDIEVVIAVP